MSMKKIGQETSFFCLIFPIPRLLNFFLFRYRCRGHEIFEVVVLEAYRKASKKRRVAVPADEIIPSRREIHMLEEPVIRPCLQMGVAVRAEIEGIKTKLELVVEHIIIHSDPARRFKEAAPEGQILPALSELGIKKKTALVIPRS
jgi:hypothetical protein